MKKLEIEFEGGGDVKGWSFKQLKRSENFAIYERSNGYQSWEVITIKKQKESDSFIAGRIIHREEKELYPNSEDFGKIAWYFRSLKDADTQYEKLLLLNGE